MDELKRILANVQYMVGEGAPEADITEYLQTEGYTLASLNQALQAPPKDTQPRPASTGTRVADALVAFGNAAGLGLPAALSKDTKNYLAAARERSPRTVGASAIAGTLAPMIATAGGALGATAGTQALGPLRVVGPSLASRGAGALAGAGRAVMSNPIARTAGTLATWEALKKIRDIFGGNRSP